MSAPISSTLPFEPAQSIMRAAASQARDLDPKLADAQAALGWVYSREFDWENAERAFERAMDLNPNLTGTYTGYSISTLQPQGKLAEALRVLRLAQHNDPLSLDVQREIGGVQLLAGQFEEAIDTFQRVRAVDPDFPFVQVNLGRALLFAGRVPEALPLLEGLDGRNLGRFKDPRAKRAPWLAQAYVLTGRRAEAASLAVEHTNSSSAMAVIHAALGDSARAFDALERMAVSEPHHVGRMLLTPELAALRGDPRFAALRARLNLPAQ
jgi:serine/threonine-protein kinase